MYTLETKIYSISELNRETKTILANHFSTIQVEGEISNLSTAFSGHIYFSLKDGAAQIRCAMFKSAIYKLDFKPENGKQVIVLAQVSLYEARGDYQLIIDAIQEAGAGRLQRAFTQLKNKLLNEGLFASEHKLALPKIPNKIGVITSSKGAAIHDVLSVLKRRFPAIPIIIYPTAVQGESAKFELCQALETVNKHNQVEVIILARGGGSLEDLWAFNEECVARSMAKCLIPIISGIGHEVDFTIADFVADFRAPTPSAAAESAVPDQQLWLAQFESLEVQLQQQISRRLRYAQQAIVWTSKSLQQQHPKQQLQQQFQLLEHKALRLKQAMQKIIKHQQDISTMYNNLLQLKSPANAITHYQEQQKYLFNSLNNTMQHKLEKLHKISHAIAQTMHALSPLATLSRGYAIISKSDNSIVYSSKQLAVNDLIKTRLDQGQVISKITKLQHE